MKSLSDIANPWINGLAVYEPGRPIDEVAREMGFASAEEIVKLASNENALGPSPMAMAAMHNAVGDMHRYPDGGSYYLKKALSARLGITSEQILPATGSNEILELLGHVFLSPGASIVMARYAFIVYRLIAASARAKVIDVPMIDYTHDLPAMLKAITEDTRIVYISNPNNPTSTLVGQVRIDEFMSSVPDHVVVCFDEAYVELLAPDKQPDTLKYVRQGKNVVVLRTFSKTYGLAGLRIGYAVAPEECIRLLNRVRQPFNVNAMAMSAAVAALADDEHLARTRSMVSDGLAYLCGAFERLGLDFVPPEANFVLVKVGEGRRMFEDLQAEGVIVRPMDGYGLPDYIRVTVGRQEENQQFVDALESMLT